jgi:hypothetical protein
MSLKKIIAVLILTSSSLVFADPASGKQDNERKWTILAAENNATKGNLDNKKVCTDPGVFVTAQRDPQDKK